MKKLFSLILCLLCLIAIYYAVLFYKQTIPLTQIQHFFTEKTEDKIEDKVKNSNTKNTYKVPLNKTREVFLNEHNKYFYLNALTNDEEVFLYQEIVKVLDNKESSLIISSAFNSESIDKVVNYILGDHPEYFWLTGAYTIYNYDYKKEQKINFVFSLSPEEIQARQAQIEAMTDALIASWPADYSEYDKVKAVYEYIILNTSYGFSSSNNQNIQSIFFDKSSVCAGYAKATQYILQRAGISCSTLTGKIPENGQNHAWNLVLLNHEYLYLDTTWGDPTFAGNTTNVLSDNDVNYDYLCITKEEILRTRTPDTLIDLPPSQSNSFDYYSLNNKYYNEFSPLLKENLMHEINSGIEYSAFKFSNLSAYQSTYSYLFQEGGAEELAKNRAINNHSKTYGYTFYGDEQLYTIKIKWQ